MRTSQPSTKPPTVRRVLPWPPTRPRTIRDMHMMGLVCIPRGFLMTTGRRRRRRRRLHRHWAIRPWTTPVGSTVRPLFPTSICPIPAAVPCHPSQIHHHICRMLIILLFQNRRVLLTLQQMTGLPARSASKERAPHETSVDTYGSATPNTRARTKYGARRFRVRIQVVGIPEGRTTLLGI